MRFILIINFTFLLVSLFSCSKKKITTDSRSDALTIINVELDKYVKGDIRDFIDSVEFIKLETIEESLIHDINELRINSGKIFISDLEQQLILIFNENGGFECKIDKVGRGPDEYDRILNFDIDKDYIYILGHSQVIIYDHKGDFIKKITINPNDFLPTRICVDEEFIYFYTISNLPEKILQATIVIYDKEFNLINAVMDPFYYRDKSFRTRKIFTKSEIGTFYHEVKNDTIYNIDSKLGLIPRFYLNCGKYNVTHDIYDRLPRDKNDFIILSPNMIFPIDNILISNKFLYFQAHKYQNGIYKMSVGVYSFLNDRLFVFDENINKQREPYGLQFLENVLMVDSNNYFYSIREPLLISFQRENGDVLDERMDELNEDSNPYIMKFKFKDF